MPTSTEPAAHLLQSPEWKAFQESIGRTTHHIEIDDKLSAVLVKYPLPLGQSYIYCPRGPAMDYTDPKATDLLKEFIDQSKAFAKEQGSGFLRIDPEVENTDENKKPIQDAGFTHSSYEIQPSHTRILDLTPSEDDILAQMKQKWRYNIRRAAKKGVVITEDASEQGVDKFHHLLEQTTSRNNFSGHEKQYYLDLTKFFAQDHTITIYHAFTPDQDQANDQPIASIMVSFYKNRATYLHGASDYEHRNLMAPHALQWHAIQQAKSRNCTEYDFWGVAPKDAPGTHSWAGITRFKEGFGGEYKEWIGSYDLIFKPISYHAYALAKQLRNRGK